MSRPEPVRLGFLGAGSIATHALAPAVHAADGVVLAAAAARDLGRARALVPERAYDSYQAVLDDPSVDAVYVALANDAHLPWAAAALRAGKHVLCEKPLALDVGEVDALVASAAAAARLLVEASWYQWHPRIDRARELLGEGAIGRVEHVEGGFLFNGVGAGNYRLDASRGGGAGYDVGCYPVSAVLWSAGAVTAVAARSRLGPTGVDLSTEYVLDLDSRASASVSCSMADDPQQWLVITGDHGQLGLPGHAFTSRDEPSVLELSRGSGTERLEFAPADPYRLMVESFAAAARGDEAFVVPLVQSRDCAAVLAAGRDSAERGGEPVLLS